MEHRIKTKEEAIQTLKSNLCGICPYSCSDMDSCDMRYCDDKDAIEFLEKETQPCEDTISRKHLLSEIDELMQSPWFNNGKDFYDDTMRHYGYVERKEAVEVVRDLCVKAEPAVIPRTTKCEDVVDDDAIILIPAKRKEIVVEPDISDLYPPTIFKRPCSNCANEDSINICDQCCFNYDSWFRKKVSE